MKALILAAGRGSRMGHHTNSKPKALSLVGGSTLLNRLCHNFDKANVKEISAVTGYLAELIQDPLIKHKFHNSKWDSTNMLSSMLCAKELFDTDDIIVSYSDIFYESSLILDLKAANDDCDIAISYDTNFLELWSKRFANPLEDLETFKINPSGYITGIGGKPKTVSEIEGQYMGVLLFRKHSWKSIYDYIMSLNYQKMSMTELLQELIKAGFKIKGIPYSKPWGEVDTPTDQEFYNRTT